MREVRIAGHRLEVLHHPPQDHGGPTIVFLHEGLGSARQWRDFPKRLASLCGCGFLVYSRWGYGGSEARPRPWPADFLEDEAAVVLPELLDSAGITQPVLFGHSDGATIALMYAAALPDGVRGVISEAAHVMLEPISIEGIARARDRFLHGDLRARLHRQHGDHVDDTVLGWTGNWLRPELRTLGHSRTAAGGPLPGPGHPGPRRRLRDARSGGGHRDPRRRARRDAGARRVRAHPAQRAPTRASSTRPHHSSGGFGDGIRDRGSGSISSQ